MVKKVINCVKSLNFSEFCQGCFAAYCLFAICTLCALMIVGCLGKKESSTAKAIPASIQSYEVPIADTSTIPELLHLAPGQSAMLLKDVIVVARIPYNGDELYVGEVRIQKGTMLVKPKVDP